MFSVGRIAPAAAQTGVIAFEDACTRLLYAMRGDGTGRIELPFPPLPDPTDAYRGARVLDVSTTGPVTVVYYVGMGPPGFGLDDYGVFAVQLNDVAGVLVPDTPVRLALPLLPSVDPNAAQRGSFSPSGDRLALVASSQTARVLMTANIERDAALKITGLSDLVEVGDLYLAGSPDPSFPTASGFTGDIDYALDGSNSIVASIYLDLWRIDLNSPFPNATRLTPNSDGFVEWNPASSPDGIRIAYTRGKVSSAPDGEASVRESDIYSLAVASGAASAVTSNKNKGQAARLRNNAMWSPDGEQIGFTAYVSRTPRNAPCSSLVNSEIFVITADGSARAEALTNTNGTSVELWPRWGW
jgi:Tol biopolymer transport system component